MWQFLFLILFIFNFPLAEAREFKLTIPSRDQTSLTLRCIEPDARPEKLDRIFVISVGFGQTSHSFDHLANALSKKGAAVCFASARIAEAPASRWLALKSVKTGLKEITEDYEAVLREVQFMYPQVPIDLIGYSLGGIRISLAASKLDFQQNFPSVRSATLLMSADRLDAMLIQGPLESISAGALKMLSRFGLARASSPLAALSGVGMDLFVNMPELSDAHIRANLAAKGISGVDFVIYDALRQSVIHGSTFPGLNASQIRIPMHLMGGSEDASFTHSTMRNYFDSLVSSRRRQLTLMRGANHGDILMWNPNRVADARTGKTFSDLIANWPLNSETENRITQFEPTLMGTCVENLTQRTDR